MSKGYAVNRLAPPRKRVVRLVIGPDGFTETFDAHTVDLLCRMGLVELTEQDDPDNSESFQTKVYKATGRKAML